MPRVKGGPKTRRRRKKRLKMAEGYWGARGRLFRPATEAVDHALRYAYRDRRQRKRDFRRLWITRINAALTPYGLSYSRFMAALKKAGITLNRKILSDMAITDSTGFAHLVQQVAGEP